jgi:hypothetical protein
VCNDADRNDKLPGGIIAGMMDRRYDVWDMQKLGEMINCVTIPFEELTEQVTDKIKKHKSIKQGRTANEYTYRVILFVQHGGSFRFESRENLETIWIRDSNVFTAGEDYELEDGKPLTLLNEHGEGIIRKKLLEAYEATSSTNLGDPSSDGPEDYDPEYDPFTPKDKKKPSKSGGSGTKPSNEANTATKRKHPDNTTDKNETTAA